LRIIEQQSVEQDGRLFWAWRISADAAITTSAPGQWRPG
jgi:hypothetical protein